MPSSLSLFLALSFSLSCSLALSLSLSFFFSNSVRLGISWLVGCASAGLFPPPKSPCVGSCFTFVSFYSFCFLPSLSLIAASGGEHHYANYHFFGKILQSKSHRFQKKKSESSLHVTVAGGSWQVCGARTLHAVQPSVTRQRHQRVARWGGSDGRERVLQRRHGAQNGGVSFGLPSTLCACCCALALCGVRLTVIHSILF